nr:unnamed protein product [Digitaria exilis]
MLVDAPFEFADDPVLEEQLQQQFTEEGNFTRCDECALTLDAIDPLTLCPEPAWILFD